MRGLDSHVARTSSRLHTAGLERHTGYRNESTISCMRVACIFLFSCLAASIALIRWRPRVVASVNKHLQSLTSSTWLCRPRNSPGINVKKR